VTARARTAAVAGLTALGLTGCAGTSPDDEDVAASSPPPSSSGNPAAGTSTQPDADTRLVVDVVGGQATGDTGRVPVTLGDRVQLVVTSDTADELHLHGYDLEAELVPGEPATLHFPADIPGVFEAELHGAGTVLLSLQVG
jgi:hypothetical protein